MHQTEQQIGFVHLGIGNLLKQYRLTVPLHQREYAWTDKEVTRLFFDFSRSISQNERAYFLGTIVTIPREPGVLEVIDGQQRLATTAILLHAIKHALLEREETIAESITSFLVDYSADRRSTTPKLKLNAVDNETFCRLMDGEGIEPSRPSHYLLQDAFTQARKYVKKILEPHDVKTHGDELNKWIDFTQFYAQVVLLKVPNPANAFKMFETLNDRGLRTSQSDLVKNYLFGESDDRLVETQRGWESMRAMLSTLDSEEDQSMTFIRWALICIGGHLTESEVFDKIQTTVRGRDAAVRFATDIDHIAGEYVAIFNPEHEKWNAYDRGVRRAIETLNLLNVKPMRPLMLAIAAKFEPRETRAAYDALISWAVRLLIAGSTRSGSVELPLAKWANEVYLGTKTTAVELGDEASIIPPDSQFRDAFRTARVSSAKLGRYYLRSIEYSAKDSSDPFYLVNDDQQVINLEHVMPLRPEDNWPDTDAETVRTYGKRIGNLTLLRAAANSDLRSASFDEKKKVFAKTPYQITTMIADHDVWGPDEIEERQKVLADFAVDTWPL